MFDDKGFDELLHRAGQENKELFLKQGPDFSRIESAALSACEKTKRKRRTTLIWRVVAACVGFVLFLNLFLLFTDIGPVRAYQQQVKKLVFNIFSNTTDSKVESVYIKESDEIRKVQKLVPFKIPQPGRLPSGYALKTVQMRDDGNQIYTVILKYFNGNDLLIINISNDTSISDTVPSPGEGGFEQLKVNGNDVYLAVIPVDSAVRSSCYFYNKQGLAIFISAPVDKQSLVDIIGSMN